MSNRFSREVSTKIMATSDDRGELSPRECKPGDRPGGFSRPWMVDFLRRARRTGDIPAALELIEGGWGDYHQARQEDMIFEAACLELDQVVRVRTVTTLEGLASTGNIAAAKLLIKELRKVREEIAELVGQGGHRATPGAPEPDADDDGGPAAEGPCRDCWDGLHAECPHCGEPVVIVAADREELPWVVDREAEGGVSRKGVVRDGDRPRDLARAEAADRRRRTYHAAEPDDPGPGPGEAPEPLMSEGWRPHQTEQDQYEQVSDEHGHARFRRIRIGR